MQAADNPFSPPAEPLSRPLTDDIIRQQLSDIKGRVRKLDDMLMVVGDSLDRNQRWLKATARQLEVLKLGTGLILSLAMGTFFAALALVIGRFG